MGYLFNIFKEKADQFSDKTALISNGEQYSYAHLLEQANLWSQRLYKPTKRSRVGLLTENPFHTISISLGIAQLDGTCIPTNPQMLPDQLLKGWTATDVNVVIYEPCFEEKIKECASSSITFLSTDDITPYTSTDLPIRFDWSDETDFLITLSSGSTGVPKPIIISQRVKALRAEQAWNMYDLKAEDTVLCASPYFHSLGQRLVYVPLLLGATLVHMTQFTPKEWLALVDQHQVTYTTSVSSHLYALKESLLNNAEQLKSLKTIVTSSAPIDAQFKDDLFKAIGCDFHEIYGATEIACASNLFPCDAQEKFATVGTFCKDVDIKILSDDLIDLPSSEIGEIAVKTPLCFEGYYNQPELTKNAMHDGYFLTGDLGTIDENGFLSYIARKKDIIITGGINIYPSDIEDTLLGHDDLEEIAVIGVEDDLLGEVIVAVCAGQEIERDLRRIANQKLAPFQRPLKYFFVESLPLTDSGKLSKKALREKYAALNNGWTMPLRMMLYGECA